MIERVVTYSISMHQEKSLLYKTSGDFSLTFGYYIPISEHAMRICNDMEFVSRQGYNIQSLSSLFIKRQTNRANISDAISIYKTDYGTNVNDIAFAETTLDNGILVEDIWYAKDDSSNKMNINVIEGIHKESSKIEVSNDYWVNRNNSTGAFVVHSIDTFDKYHHISQSTYDILVGSDRNKNNIYVGDDTCLLTVTSKSPFVNETILMVDTNDKGVVTSDSTAIGVKDKIANILVSDETISTSNNYAYLEQEALFLGDINKGVIVYDSIPVGRTTGQLNGSNDCYFTKTQSKPVFSVNSLNLVDKYPSGLFDKKDFEYMGHNKAPLNYIDSLLGLSGYGVPLFNTDDIIELDHFRKPIYGSNDALHIGRKGGGLFENPSDVSLEKNNNSTTSEESFYAKKTTPGVWHGDIFYINEEVAHVNIDYSGRSIFKNDIGAAEQIGAMNVEKDKYNPILLVDSYSFHSKYFKQASISDLLISLDKHSHAFIYNNDSFFVNKETLHPVFIKDDVSGIIGAGKPTFSHTSFTFFSKYYKGFDIKNSCIFLKKDVSGILVAFSELTTLYKWNKRISEEQEMIAINKGTDGLYINNVAVCMHKTSSGIKSDKVYSAKKEPKDFTVFDVIGNISKTSRPIDDIRQFMFIGKSPLGIDGLKSFQFIDRASNRRIFCSEIIHIGKKSIGFSTNNKDVTLGENAPVYIPDGYNARRGETTRANIPTDSNDFLKISDYRHVYVSDNNQTSVVDENVEDKYITTNYKSLSGIDELILPHSDFDYTVYEESLILNETINPKYIKRIENGNVCIKYPIENPIKPFADIATLYMDVAVNTFEYIIKKAYSIWRENIFTYSGMKPDAAVRDLVKQVYANLELHFVDDKELYQAYRVARLFRWYSEMSVLNNSEYMLKLNCREVKPDYVNIDTIDIERVALLENLHLTNNLLIESKSIGKEASINMSCEKYHPIYLRTKMYVYDGYVECISNGKSTEYRDAYTELDLEVPIGESTLEVKFHPLNENGRVQFSQFEISNYHIESYEIAYKGKVGESNKTIEYLISTLIIAEDAMDNIQANIGNITPIANALESMRRYFELHHEDKTKGKRLINKFS